MNTNISKESLNALLVMQQNECTESEIYRYLASKVKDPKTADILNELAAQELSHYEIWKTYTGKELKPQKGKILLAKISYVLFGFTFTIKKPRFSAKTDNCIDRKSWNTKVFYAR